MPITLDDSRLTRLTITRRYALVVGVFAMVIGAGTFIASFFTEEKSFGSGAVTFILGSMLFEVSDSIKRVLKNAS
ncbi:MAG: hypothetical protein V1778_05130 [bacterium]